MKRRLYNIAVVTSLVLFVVVAVVWARSLRHIGAVYWIGPEHKLALHSIDGVFGIQFARDSGLRPSVSGTDRLYGWFSWRKKIAVDRDRASFNTLSFNKWGFGFHVGKTVGKPSGWWRFGGRRLFIVYLPYWLLSLLASILPVRCFIRWWWRWRKRDPDAVPCAKCGYDLRGSPSGACPECGEG